MRRSEVTITRTNEGKRMTTCALHWFLPLPAHHITPQLGARAMRSLRTIFRRNYLPLGAVEGRLFSDHDGSWDVPVSSLLGKNSYFSF